MHYTIKHVTTEQELDAVLAFDKKVFGLPSERHSPAYSREKLLERMKTHGDLMLYAESDGEVIAIVFGRIENGSSITVGPVAVDEHFRKHGIARELMLLLEKRAIGHGIYHLGLGAVESAEGFYQKLGYTGTLLVQSEKHSIEKLLSLNEKYPVKNTSVYDGTVNQVFLDLPSPDRELQRRYENTLPGCYTQMVFGKTIKAEDYKMKNDKGNYAHHAQYWDWGDLDHDRTMGDEKNYNFAKQYGNSILIPMCAWGHLGAYMAERGMKVTAFDITPEMIAEGKKRFGGIKNLSLFVGDATDFRFDIEPVDVCAFAEFGHIHSMDEVKKALVCINNHLRDGGYLILEEFIGAYDSQTGPETFRVKNNPYPDRTVYKTGTTRNESATRRCYISQIVHVEYNDGRKEQFDHEFYLQGYTREEWFAALRECGFEVKAEYKNREKEPWSEGDGQWIVEAVKSTAAKKRYSPAVSFDYLQTPIYRYENVALYNDKINLEQPNSGYHQFYRFDINADGNWVGFIHVWIGYSIKIHYCGQIGYGINEQYQNRGYMTKACLAIKPFLRKCGFKHVLITNDENNLPSRHVCEKIGATLIETVDTPAWTGMYGEGQRRTCIYEWTVEDTAQQNISKMNLCHAKIDLAANRDYILERHCRINYECDTPWARKLSYEQYRANWFANTGQQNEFLSALRESMEDKRTIAEIIKTETGEAVGYLWVPFHGEDLNFIWADVQDIYIEDAYRKTGVASYLMDYAERSAKKNGAKVIRSGTGCENVKSQAMHQKMGYYQYRMEYEKVLEAAQND